MSTTLIGPAVRVQGGRVSVLFELALIVSQVDARLPRFSACIGLPGTPEFIINCLETNHLVTPRVQIKLRPKLVDDGAMLLAESNATSLWSLGKKSASDGRESMYDNGGTKDFNTLLPAIGMRYLLAELSVAEDDIPAREALAQLDLRRGHTGLLDCARQLEAGLGAEITRCASDKMGNAFKRLKDRGNQDEAVHLLPVHWGRADAGRELTLLEAYEFMFMMYGKYAMELAKGPVAGVATLHKDDIAVALPKMDGQDFQFIANQADVLRISFFDKKKQVLSTCDFRAPGVEMYQIVTHLLRVLDSIGLDHAEYDRHIYPALLDGQKYVCHPSMWPAKANQVLH